MKRWLQLRAEISYMQKIKNGGSASRQSRAAPSELQLAPCDSGTALLRDLFGHRAREVGNWSGRQSYRFADPEEAEGAIERGWVAGETLKGRAVSVLQITQA
jgi:hypothetical protein